MEEYVEKVDINFRFKDGGFVPIKIFLDVMGDIFMYSIAFGAQYVVTFLKARESDVA